MPGVEMEWIARSGVRVQPRRSIGACSVCCTCDEKSVYSFMRGRDWCLRTVRDNMARQTC